MKFKLTKQRNQIIEVFKNSDIPLSAELLHQKLSDPTINLSTVYRTIDTLMVFNIISKIYLNNLACYYYNHHDHIHYMVCETCHKMLEIDCISNHFHQVAEHNKFKMTHHDLVIYGICKDCQKLN
ncbi:MAG TPA: Fur family transcriptional regulator [Bacilli bacterium]|nr:Fur family transcriptional regulator [Bacilli bacterium]